MPNPSCATYVRTFLIKKDERKYFPDELFPDSRTIKIYCRENFSDEVLKKKKKKKLFEGGRIKEGQVKK